MFENTAHRADRGAQEDVARRRALFPGLVYSESGRPASVVEIGGVAHYAVDDQGFVRHVEAAHVDRAVIARLQEHIGPASDALVSGMLRMLGKDDLFTKAALEASVRNLEDSFYRGDPAQWSPWLRMFGFRIIVDVHGDLVELILPEPPDGGEE